MIQSINYIDNLAELTERKDDRQDKLTEDGGGGPKTNVMSFLGGHKHCNKKQNCCYLGNDVQLRQTLKINFQCEGKRNTSHLTNKTRKETRLTTYKTMQVASLIYESESWVVGKRNRVVKFKQ